MDILEEVKVPHQLQLFSGVKHGFALRGDMNDPYERKFPLLYDGPLNSLENLLPVLIFEKAT